MFQKMFVCCALAVMITFSACQNEGEELSPSTDVTVATSQTSENVRVESEGEDFVLIRVENHEEHLVAIDINGERKIVDMTPPPPSVGPYWFKVHWVHIGYTREPDGSIRSVWEDLHAHPKSTCRYAVYVGNGGFRCESRKPSMY